MGVGPTSGTIVSIGTTAANASTDTYTAIGEITNIGEFGRAYNEITHASIANRNVRKFKGNRNDGSLALDLAMDVGDAGQDAVEAALDSDADYNFKIVFNDDDQVGGTPTTITFKAKVMAFPFIPGGGESVTMRRISLGIQTGTITKADAS